MFLSLQIFVTNLTTLPTPKNLSMFSWAKYRSGNILRL